MPVPETTYRRDLSPPSSGSKSTVGDEKKDESIPSTPPERVIPPVESYVSSLRVYNGIYPTQASIFSLLMRPFILIFTPVCLWAGLLYGVAITWLVLIATSVAQIFSAPRK